MDSEASSLKPDRVPRLLILEEFFGETKHVLYNPLNNSSPVEKYPELILHNVQCLASAHGWILLLSRESSSLFFLNPFTGRTIYLPYRRSLFSAATFSAAPDSPDCHVFAVCEDYLRGKIDVDVLHVWYDNDWTRHDMEGFEKKQFSVVSKAICCNGILYCMDSRGRVASFDRRSGIWNIICEQTTEKLKNSCFFEYKGELFAVENKSEETYKLIFEDEEKTKAHWEAVEQKEDLYLYSDSESDWELVNEDNSELGSESTTSNDVPNHMFLGPYGSCAVSWLGGKWRGKTWPPFSGPFQTPIWIDRN